MDNEAVQKRANLEDLKKLLVFKICKMLAKIGSDTAENEPSKVTFSYLLIPKIL